MNNEQRIVNEKWFINVIKHTNKIYFWIDQAESYHIINHRKMKPATRKGYEALSAIVRPSFMDIFVEPPATTESV